MAFARVSPALALWAVFSWMLADAGAATEIAQAQPPRPAPPNGPTAAGGPVKVSITGQCEGGDAVFLVINEGDPWPVPSRITVYRTQGRSLVSQRLMRLTAGQRASFRVKGAAAAQAEFGVFVEPAWYQRPFVYDATITCK